MEIEPIDCTEYSKIFIDSFIPYNTVAFNKLNYHKCDKLECLLFHEAKEKIGLIAGIKDDALFSPFSAPFSIFSFQSNHIKTECILLAINALEDYSNNNHYNSLRFVLPPSFYNEHIISKLIYCYYRSNYSAVVDDNHCFYTKNFIMYENHSIGKGVRYNIRIATTAGLVFKKANSMDNYRIAYDIIKTNKESKNRPLKMTFDQIMEMNGLIDIDFFIVYHSDNPIASAIIYNYTPKIVQIIYWGNLPEFNCYYPMNFLAMNIFRYYRERNIDIIDMGNSSYKGEPNFGLSNFKEIIGCTVATKFTFSKTL